MTRRKVLVRNVSVWLAVVVVFEGGRIALALTGPPSPDLYANELGFQLAVSALFLFVGWLPLLGGVLLFSTTFAHLRARSLESKGERASTTGGGDA